MHLGCPADVLDQRETFAAYLMFESMGNPMGEAFYSLPQWWQEAIGICRDEWSTIREGRRKVAEAEQRAAVRARELGNGRGVRSRR